MFDPEAVMPKATAELYLSLINEPQLNHFHLIGGTALALHIGHRLSEDLDLIIKTPKLPLEQIDAVLAKLRDGGKRIVRNDPPAAYDDFLSAGMSLHDYCQDFVVDNSCKLTFFTAEAHHKRLLCDPQRDTGLTVASLEELKNLKAIVCASRSSSRDWLDVYLLARYHGFDLLGWRRAFEKAGLSRIHMETALSRIVSGRLPRTDPGFKPLLTDPPTIAQISQFFESQIEKAYPFGSVDW